MGRPRIEMPKINVDSVPVYVVDLYYAYMYHVYIMNAVRVMGLVRITSWYPNFNGSHFGMPPREIHRMTGLPPKIA